MSTKLKLVKKLEGTFPVTITVKDLEGTEYDVKFQCKQRTQKEWSKERDKMIADAREKIKAETEKAVEQAAEEKPSKKAKPAPVDELTIESLAADRLNSEAKLAFVIAESWSLEEDFDVSNVENLEDMFPGSVFSLHEEYSKAIYGNRRKN